MVLVHPLDASKPKDDSSISFLVPRLGKRNTTNGQYGNLSSTTQIMVSAPAQCFYSCATLSNTKRVWRVGLLAGCFISQTLRTSRIDETDRGLDPNLPVRNTYLGEDLKTGFVVLHLLLIL